jgi:hypothetical protein
LAFNRIILPIVHSSVHIADKKRCYRRHRGMATGAIAIPQIEVAPLAVWRVPRVARAAA